MTSLAELTHRAIVTACSLTHTTERAARRVGVAPFLPRLHATRITHLGGIAKAEFVQQLADCRSFDDERWTRHWQRFATEHLMRADAALLRLGGPSTAELLDASTRIDIDALGRLLAPAVTLLADRGTIADPTAPAQFCADHPESADAAQALDGLIKAMVYELAAAWPGWSPRRLQAYRRSRRLGETLLIALAPAMDLTIEMLEIPVGRSDVVRGYLLLPTGTHAVPTVLATNGLEGTLEEMTIPLLAQRGSGLGMFVMEMPGTYSYSEHMSPASESVYSTVIDHLTAHPRVDADHIGILGFSFGGYWSTRMAAVDSRLKVAVSNGALTHRSFKLSGSFGTPEIIVSTMRHTTGAATMADLARKLATYSLAQHYRRISIPILVVNGSHDTLVSTQDSIDLATAAPQGQLVLYDGDDHCAMEHSREWSELSLQFLRQHLMDSDPTEAVAP